MDERVSVIRIDSTKLIRVSTSIPDTIDQLIVAVEIASIISKFVILPMRHRRELDCYLLYFNTTSSVMEQAEISESSAFVLPINGVVTWACNMEPESFVDSSIGRGIATFSGNPERRFSISEANVLVVVYIPNLERDNTRNILYSCQ